jgi:hypothetical protein
MEPGVAGMKGTPARRRTRDCRQIVAPHIVADAQRRAREGYAGNGHITS